MIGIFCEGNFERQKTPPIIRVFGKSDFVVSTPRKRFIPSLIVTSCQDGGER